MILRVFIVRMVVWCQNVKGRYHKYLERHCALSTDVQCIFLCFLYFAGAAYLYQASTFQAYLCLLMAALIPLLYLSLRIYSSGSRLSGWVNVAVMAYVNYVFINKVI